MPEETRIAIGRGPPCCCSYRGPIASTRVNRPAPGRAQASRMLSLQHWKRSARPRAECLPRCRRHRGPRCSEPHPIPALVHLFGATVVVDGEGHGPARRCCSGQLIHVALLAHDEVRREPWPARATGQGFHVFIVPPTGAGGSRHVSPTCVSHNLNLFTFDVSLFVIPIALLGLGRRDTSTIGRRGSVDAPACRGRRG